MAANRQFCTFYLGKQCYGLDVLRVQEIVRSQPLTRVPLAHRMVRGLINLRGQIVTAIDMRARFGLPPQPESALPMNVVIRATDGVVSLLVDDIGDVLEVDERTFERVPETLAGPLREHIRGVCKLDHALLLLLDTERVRSLGLAGEGTKSVPT